jgi:hypothetical protein
MEAGMNFNRVLGLGLVLAVVASPALAQKKDPNPIKIFVTANTGGFSDERSQSAADLEKALFKKSIVIPAKNEADADVTVEVMGRDRIDLGQETKASVYTKLLAGDYSTNIEGSYTALPYTKLWRFAADDAARKIEIWVKANYFNLIRRRGQK